MSTSSYLINLERYKNDDLTTLGTTVAIDWYNLSHDTITELLSLGYDVPDEIWLPHFLNMLVAPKQFLSSHYDKDLHQSELSSILKTKDHYLVYNKQANWKHNHGYFFCDDICDTVLRKEEAHIRPCAVSKGGKTLVCREYSNDIPIGAVLIIVALTEKEYEKLKNASPYTIYCFAEQHRKTAVYL